jgi:O-antigen ligase
MWQAPAQTIVSNVELPKSQGLIGVVAWTGVITTLAINPWLGYDPINLPKMLTMSTGAAFLLGWLILNLRSISKSQFLIFTLSVAFLLSLVFSYISNEAPWAQQLWGIWGRSTGLVSYVSFIVILLASAALSSSESMVITRRLFERLGYFITFYTLIQLLDLDPINWSQKIMIATLGNLNFMSSFLGLTSISYTARVLVEKSPIITKTFFLILTAVNIFLVAKSESIQGIGVYFAGITLLASFYIRRKISFAKAIWFLLTSSFVGFLSLLGTAGVGPLSGLRQDTVLFRLDYWRAGLNMLRANPLNGVGLDSYGDFYRQYRDLEAVTRTGPQRVTNTAHNIFLDIFAGAGVLAGTLFLLLMLVCLFAILMELKRNTAIPDFQVFGAMWSGFIVFCCISINQIGVGIWGFIFTGLIIGFMTKSKSEISSERVVPKSQLITKNRKLESQKYFSKVIEGRGRAKGFWRIALSSALSVAVFASSLLPNMADVRFMKSTRNPDSSEVLGMADVVGAQSFHIEQLIARLSKEGRTRESLELATSLAKSNPQSWQAWVNILSSPLSTRSDQLEAARNIFRLDPNNKLVQQEINTFLYP